MQALHYYIKKQGQQLRAEIELISELLALLDNENNENTQSITEELRDFNFRKQIDLLNFNKQLIKKRFILNEEAELERIQNDVNKLKNLREKLCDPNGTTPSSKKLTQLIESLEKHKTHFTSDGIGTRIFQVAKKAVGFTGDTWDAARGMVASSTELLSQLSPAISGFFDSFTLVGETIVNFMSGKKAAEKYEIGKKLYQSINKEDELNNIQMEYQLSDEKVNKYKTADTDKQNLLKQKNDLQWSRFVTGTTNGALGLFGTASCWTTIGIGIASLLQSLGVIAIPVATLGMLGLVATGLCAAGPFVLAAIFANKLHQKCIEYDVQQKVTENAKKDFKDSLNAAYPKNTDQYTDQYEEYKTAHETSSHCINNSTPEDKKFLSVYEKEIIYRKEKQKLKSISVEKSFSKIELGAALFTVVGATLIGLSSFFSFGIVPTVIIVTGSAIALGAATFEYVDRKNGHKYSDYLSNKFKEFKNWALPNVSKNDKKKMPAEIQNKATQKAQSKNAIKKSALSLVPDINPRHIQSDFKLLDSIYAQLQGKEQKIFRQAAWSKIESMKFSNENDRFDFLTEARKHRVFNEHRGFGLFSRTATVEQIDTKIREAGEKAYAARSSQDKQRIETETRNKQYEYILHR